MLLPQTLAAGEAVTVFQDGCHAEGR